MLDHNVQQLGCVEKLELSVAADNLKGSALLSQAAECAVCPQARTGRNQHAPGTGGPEGSQKPSKASRQAHHTVEEL